MFLIGFVFLLLWLLVGVGGVMVGVIGYDGFFLLFGVLSLVVILLVLVLLWIVVWEEV